MAADGVEGEGGAHADDGAGEETREHQLLLVVDLNGGPRQEVGGDYHKADTP